MRGGHIVMLCVWVAMAMPWRGVAASAPGSWLESVQLHGDALARHSALSPHAASHALSPRRQQQQHQVSCNGTDGRSFCHNGGKCQKAMNYLGDVLLICNCPPHFEGRQCEAYNACFPACANGGICQTRNKKCKCPKGYGGPYCNVKKGDTTETNSCMGRAVQRGFNTIQKQCCTQPNGKKLDCSLGPPRECTARCAAAFLPTWEDCSGVMGSFAHTFRIFALMCNATMVNAENKGGVSSSTSLVDPGNEECEIQRDAPFEWVEISPRKMAQKGHPLRNKNKNARKKNTFGTRINNSNWKSTGVNKTDGRTWETDDGWFDLNLGEAGNSVWEAGFLFYGVEEKILTIGTNGILTFGTNQFPYGNTEPIPCAGHNICADGMNEGLGVDGMIAVDWADLYPGLSTNGYGVYYAITDEQIVIEYAGIKSWSWSCGLAKCWNIKDPGQTFQLILYPDGSFKMQYLSMYCKKCITSWSQESTGFEDQTGLKGQQIAYGSVPASRSAVFIPTTCTNTQFGGGASQT